MNARRYKGHRYPTWLRYIFALLAAGIVSFALLFGAVMYGAYDHIREEPQVVVVLGCQVMTSGPSILLKDRLDEALAYLQAHPGLPVVVSGGQGPDEPTTEARAMADYLMAQGVAEETIFLEDQSHNTAQNISYTKVLLQQKGYDLASTEVLVVSNGFHLTRARLLAQRMGFEEISTLAAPSSHVPSRLKMYIREPFALVKSFLFDH